MMVRLRLKPPAAPMLGWLPPDGITTSVVAPGIPPHQLVAVFQSVLVVPCQLPAVHPAEAVT